jgi:drug/metabolite transporter (DMT)-like permease
MQRNILYTPSRVDRMEAFSGPVLVAIGAVIISFSPILVRVASVGPTMAGFYRSLFGAITLFVFSRFKGGSIRMDKTALFLSALAAILFGTGLSFWHRSIHVLGPGLATILSNFQVFFLGALGMILLKERIGLRLVSAMVMAMCGIVLLVGPERWKMGLDYRTGMIFGLSAALAYALYVLTLQKLQRQADPIGRLNNFTVISILCAIFMGCEGLIQGESFFIPDLTSLLAMIAYGIFCQALGWILISNGLPRMAASRAGLLLLLQPSGAFLWDILLFNRPATGWDLLGAGLALAAIYIGSTKK